MTVVCTKCGALSIAQCTCSVITHNQYVYGGAIQMTDISNLKPGDALTYEQAMALPDGDVVSAIWGGSEVRMYFTVGSKDPFGDPRKFGGSILEREEYWSADRWHSVRLESMPDPAKPDTEHLLLVINCDRCGITHKIDERHACPPLFTKPDRQACDYCDCGYKPENCKGCGPEPAKPERQASEIEKEAARCLLSERLAAFISEVTKCSHISHESIFSVHAKIEGAYCRYTYAKDYAKSIGAISE